MSWKVLINDFVVALNDFTPEIIVTPHPMMDSHPDHQYASVALFDALKITKLNPLIFFYTNHPTLSEKFPYGPVGSIQSLMPFDNDRIFFDSIYSQSLTNNDMQRKFMALCSMSELRSIKDVRDQFIDSWTIVKKIRSYFRKYFDLILNFSNIFIFNESYLRRGMMKNEIFYCATTKEAQKHIDLFCKEVSGNYNDRNRG